MSDLNQQHKPVLCIGGLGSTLAASLIKRLNGRWRIAGYSKNTDKITADWAEDACIMRADALQPGEIAQALNSITSETGQIDAYVHCVGSILLKSLHQTRPDEWEQVLRINLHSAIEAAGAILPMMMKQKHGTLVFISSVAADKGLPGHEAISAAKGGLQSMVRSAAASYASYGIRFNVIAPGLVESNLSKKLLAGAQARETAERMHPLGRVGQPENISSLIEWLISDEADWVTGEVFHIDGGLASIQRKMRA